MGKYKTGELLFVNIFTCSDVLFHKKRGISCCHPWYGSPAPMGQKFYSLLRVTALYF